MIQHKILNIFHFIHFNCKETQSYPRAFGLTQTDWPEYILVALGKSRKADFFPYPMESRNFSIFAKVWNFLGMKHSGTDVIHPMLGDFRSDLSKILPNLKKKFLKVSKQPHNTWINLFKHKIYAFLYSKSSFNALKGLKKICVNQKSCV